MTREEAIQHLLKFSEDNKYYSNEMGYLSGLIITALSNPWHKAAEELPNYATRVEIVHQVENDMDIHIGVLLPLPDKQIWKIDDGRCLNENEVTYWRQLPELPKED